MTSSDECLYDEDCKYMNFKKLIVIRGGYGLTAKIANWKLQEDYCFTSLVYSCDVTGLKDGNLQEYILS